MLAHFHERVARSLAHERVVTLSTHGPAGLQAGRFPCAGLGACLYVLVPRTADLLANLASGGRLIATAESWQIHGPARILDPGQIPDLPALTGRPEFPWCSLVAVQVEHWEQPHPQGWGFSESIDLV